MLRAVWQVLVVALRRSPAARLTASLSRPSGRRRADRGRSHRHADRAALARTIPRPRGRADRAGARRTRRAAAPSSSTLARPRAVIRGYGRRGPGAGRSSRPSPVPVRREHREHEHLAWLGFLLADMRVSDDAWARMDPSASGRSLPAVDRRAALPRLDFRPARGAAGVHRVAGGRRGAGRIAIERALEADPDYSMAHLIAGALEAVLPPSAARLPMTPAGCGELRRQLRTGPG